MTRAAGGREVSAESMGKMACPGLAWPSDATRPFLERLERPWTKTGLESCRWRPPDLYGYLKSGTQNEIPVYILLEVAEGNAR
jgi:hypothetical protein